MSVSNSSILRDLANYIQGELNDTATTLQHEVVFYVTENEQKYNDYITQMEYAVGNDITPTAVLLKRIFATKQDDYVYGKMLETYQLEVLAFESDKDKVEQIFYAFTEDQNTNDFDATLNLKKNHSHLTFVGLTNSKNGTNRHFISYRYEFTWDYVLGSILSDASTLKITGLNNNNAIDFLGLAFTNDKISIPNMPYSPTLFLPSTNGQQLAITFPVNASTLSLFNAVVKDNNYNNAYTLIWEITGFETVTMLMVLRGGTVNYNRDELISFTATFEKALPRTTMKVNGEDIPLLSFSFNRDYNVESIIKVEQVETRHVSSGATITARFAHDNTATSRLLLSDILNHNLDRVYALTVGITGTTSVTANHIIHTDDYIIRSGNYQYEQSGELIYEITFVKVVA
jgi:hypothetical protein